MGNIKEIFVCDDYSIFRHSPSKSYEGVSVICFDEINGGLNKKGFGTDFLMKNGIDSFFISHAKKSFFQGLSEKDILKHLSPHIDKRKVFTFGASLGGYAAIYYSDILGAKAISFSPRCSIDPLYEHANKFEVTFRHQALNEKILVNRETSPIVVVDPEIAPDKKFLDQRILPLYESNIHLIELPGATHHTARALSRQGLLKDFVLNIILKNKVNNIDFDAESNAISLSYMALLAAKNKSFSKANEYLEKIIKIKSQPNEIQRLQAYLVLSEAGELSHTFDKSNIFPSEKRIVFNQHFSQVKKSNSPKEVLLSQARTYIKLLEFQKAAETFTEIKSLYPTTQELDIDLERAKRLHANTRQWLL